MEKTLTIAIQGVRGSFHHEAATYFFGEQNTLLECRTFEEVIACVQHGQVPYAVMAIENSLAGSIIPNYHLLRHSGLEICGEVGIKVCQNLLALRGTRMEHIREIHSHPMALRQCAAFLGKHQHVKVVETFDTAGSAQSISANHLTDVGAIAGPLAARVFNLEIIAPGIEDHEMNFTRFLILKKPETEPIEQNPNKLSVYFETKHEPGSLAKLLSVISALEINLGKLQSHPIPSRNTHYGFYATLDIDHPDKLTPLKTMLDAMTTHYKILGFYNKGQTHG
jgi:prephenate dehydratase